MTDTLKTFISRGLTSAALGRMVFYLAVPILATYFVYYHPLGLPFSPSGLYSFDFNDDATITFPSLSVAMDAISRFELPFINFYNNFGTPIAGDATTLPFAPQAITYWFLPNYWAMTVNRGAVYFLTFVLLTFYFRRRFSLFTSSLCAFFVVTFPNWMWHSQHHHYQMAMLLMGLILLFQHYMATTRTAWSYSGLYGACLLLYISASPNVVALILGFAIANLALSLRKDEALRQLGAGLFLIAIGLLAWAPEIRALIQNVALSKRASSHYLESLTISLRDLVMVFLGNHKTYDTFEMALSCPLPIWIMGAIGSRRMLRTAEDRSLAVRAILLGFLPFVIVYLAVFNKNIWYAIPFFRSTDITRILWFAMIFVMFPVGCFLDRRWEAIRSRTTRWITFVSAVGLIAVYLLAPMALHLKIPLLIFPGVLMVGAVLGDKHGGPFFAFQSVRWTKAFVICLPFLIATTLLCVRGHAILAMQGGNKADNRYASVRPELVSSIPANSRVSTDRGPIADAGAIDLKVAAFRIFGSAANATLNNAAFTDYLLANRLIVVADPIGAGGAYSFSGAWDYEKLNELGIEYMITAPERGAELIQAGWTHLTNACWFDTERYGLYRNGASVGVFYLSDSGIRTVIDKSKFQVLGNHAYIDLPDIDREQTLVATFKHLPHWRLRVDGQEVPLTRGQNFLVHIPVKPGDQRVDLSYEPYAPSMFFLFLFLSVGLMGAGCAAFVRSSRRGA